MTATNARLLSLSVLLTSRLALGCGSGELTEDRCTVTLATHGDFSHDRTDSGVCRVLNERHYHYFNEEVADWGATEPDPHARLVNAEVSFRADDEWIHGGVDLPATVDLFLNDGRVFASAPEKCLADVEKQACGSKSQTRIVIKNVRCGAPLPLIMGGARALTPEKLTLDRLEIVSNCQDVPRP